MPRSLLALALILATPAWAAAAPPPAIAQAPDTEPVEALTAQAQKLLATGEDDAPRQAVRLLLRAAQRGHVPAQIQLGVVVGDPASGVHDRAGAIAWLRRAGEKGGPEAWFWLAQTLALGANGQEAEEAIALWTRAAEAGHPGAMERLAFQSSKDWDAHVKADQARATKWYGALAAKGDVDSQEEYAARLLAGRGVAADPAAAARWLEQAATQQSDAACTALAALLLDPPAGLARDPEAAVRWLRMAAGRRDEDAWLLLGELAERGDGLKQDHAEARRCYRNALDQGSLVAGEPLGRLVEQGLGGPKDAFEAAKWYSLSFTEEARKAAERLARAMTPAQRQALAKAVEAYRTWQADQP